MQAQPPSWLVEVVDDVPDFPSPGILFKDLSPLWRSPSALSRCAIALAQGAGDVDLVVGIEARGFLAGLITAQRLGVGFVAARKPGKLPGDVRSVDYALEYGTDSLQLQADAIEAGQRILIVDDVIATGGTAAAAAQLVTGAGGEVAGIRAVLELMALGGRDRLAPHRVESLWEVRS
ncbi:MAG: adenine phosphoribosyltransferase [Acidimicrobiales bacterium]